MTKPAKKTETIRIKRSELRRMYRALHEGGFALLCCSDVLSGRGKPTKAQRAELAHDADLLATRQDRAAGLAWKLMGEKP